MDESEKEQVDFEIGFYEGILERCPRFYECMKALAENYTAVGRIRDGLEMDKMIVEACPDDPVAYYNLACSYALLEDFGKAIDALEKAVEKGFDDLDIVFEDPDMEELIASPEFIDFFMRHTDEFLDAMPPYDEMVMGDGDQDDLLG